MVEAQPAPDEVELIGEPLGQVVLVDAAVNGQAATDGRIAELRGRRVRVP